MNLQRLWQMSYDSRTIDILRDSKHAIPLIQSVHLIGIVLLLGAMVDWYGFIPPLVLTAALFMSSGVLFWLMAPEFHVARPERAVRPA